MTSLIHKSKKFIFSLALIAMASIVLAQTQLLEKTNQKAPISKEDKSDTVLFDTDSVSTKTADQPIKLFFIKDENTSSIIKDILPFATLLLGIGINSIIGSRKDRRRTKKAGERWVAEIRALEDPVKKQIQLLEKLLAEEKKGEYKYPELIIISTLNCEIFKTLDKGELLKYIERKEKRGYNEAINTSNQTHGLITIFTNLHESLQKKFDEYLKGLSLHTSTVNRNLQLLSRAFAWYGADLEQELGAMFTNHREYKSMLDLFSQYISPNRNDGKYDLFLLQTDFFGPLSEVLATCRHEKKDTQDG